MNDHKTRRMKSLQYRIPDDKDAKNLVKRLADNESDYFRFIAEPIPPTNNVAEQIIRNVVIDRKITQGTRSDWGARCSNAFGIRIGLTTLEH